MKVLLVDPPSKFLIDEEVFPTLGLLYLSAYLKKFGYDNISLLDLHSNREIPNSLDADVVGFYSNTPQFPDVLKLKEKIKLVNKNKSAVYVIGGPHVSAKPEDATPYFDHVVCGEGERVFLDIVENKATDKTLRYEYMKDIDSVPFPDRDLIDIAGYKYYINGRLAATVVSSRGCPFRCAFCANNAWGKTLRLRSPENIFEEVKLLRDKYGYKAIMFFDDTITVNKKRMYALCDRLKELDIIYRCFIRSDTVDYNILTKMKDSGCVEVGIGIESGSQRILDIVDKGEKVEQHMRAIKMCKDVGIRVKGFLIIGLPGENKESVNETISFLRENKLDDFDMTIFTPYPGSKIYNNKENYDIGFNVNYEDYWYKGKPGCYKSSVFTSTISSDEIVKLRDYIEKEFKKK